MFSGQDRYTEFVAPAFKYEKETAAYKNKTAYRSMVQGLIDD